MQITRTIQGVEITLDLTSSELFQAYVAKEREFDKADMADLIEGYDDEEVLLLYGVTPEQFLSLTDEMAEVYRNSIPDIIFELEYEHRVYAAKEVIKEVCQK